MLIGVSLLLEIATLFKGGHFRYRFWLSTKSQWRKFGAKNQTELKVFSKNHCNQLILLVPEAGLEPAQPYDRGILSPLRLPISPLGQSPQRLELLMAIGNRKVR